MTSPVRCPWAEAYVEYHDQEWGVPVHDDRVLFEFLLLEGAQAGLSWATILAKREGYRRAFAGFDPAVVSRFTEADIARLIDDSGLVRNRLKIESAVSNARAFLDVQAAFGSFDEYVWQFVGGAPLRNTWVAMDEVPAQTQESTALSRDLKKRGFRFVGPTIVYAFMQAVGMVNDHLVSCFRYPQVSSEGGRRTSQGTRENRATGEHAPGRSSPVS